MKKQKFYIILITIIFSVLSSGCATISAAESTEETVILGGNPFGIKMFSEGVMVIKTEKVKGDINQRCPAEEAGIKPNDIIISANNQKLRSNEELSEIIESSQGETISLTVKREDETFNIQLTPCRNTQGIYKAGMWVKDSAAGIGTLTFYSKDFGSFCGLGHGICDKDTDLLIPIAYGEVNKACIATVTKSCDSKVGTLNGYFTAEYIGKAILNTDNGIYGKTETLITGSEIEIADEDEVKTGEALIYTTVAGQTPEYYEAEILKVNKNSYDTDIVIKITDEELLEITGGIVQGMSGSPIIQDGRLVGAVTHVIVDNVDCGYGIFAQRMMETLKESCN